MLAGAGHYVALVFLAHAAAAAAAAAAGDDDVWRAPLLRLGCCWMVVMVEGFGQSKGAHHCGITHPAALRPNAADPEQRCCFALLGARPSISLAGEIASIDRSRGGGGVIRSIIYGSEQHTHRTRILFRFKCVRDFPIYTGARPSPAELLPKRFACLPRHLRGEGPWPTRAHALQSI
jgi:hypothetical protein